MLLVLLFPLLATVVPNAGVDVADPPKVDAAVTWAPNGDDLLSPNVAVLPALPKVTGGLKELEVVAPKTEAELSVPNMAGAEPKPCTVGLCAGFCVADVAMPRVPNDGGVVVFVVPNAGTVTLLETVAPKDGATVLLEAVVVPNVDVAVVCELNNDVALLPKTPLLVPKTVGGFVCPKMLLFPTNPAVEVVGQAFTLENKLEVVLVIPDADTLAFGPKTKTPVVTGAGGAVLEAKTELAEVALGADVETAEGVLTLELKIAAVFGLAKPVVAVVEGLLKAA